LEEILLLESALFSSGKPLSLYELAEAMDIEPNAVRKHIKKLRGLYRKRNTSIEVAKVGSKYCMQVKADFQEHASRFASTRIPRRLLKTLTLIAYHQPIKQSTMVKIIGPRIYKQVRELRELGLIHYKRSGHTKIIFTTKKFPEYFGIATTTREGIKRWLREKMGISDEGDDFTEPMDGADVSGDAEFTDGVAAVDDAEPMGDEEQVDDVDTSNDAEQVDDADAVDKAESMDDADAGRVETEEESNNDNGQDD